MFGLVVEVSGVKKGFCRYVAPVGRVPTEAARFYDCYTLAFAVAAYFRANDEWRREVSLEKDYVAPGKPGWVVREEGGQRVLDTMNWGFPFQGKPGLTPFLKELHAVAPRVAGIRRFGSAALDMAYVAAGRFDGYWERDVKAWDIAAGGLLVLEAGGQVSDIDGGLFTPEKGSALVANPDLHPQLLQRLQAAAG